MEKHDEREMNRAENSATARSPSKRSFPYFKIAGMVLLAAVSSYLIPTIWYKLCYSNEKYYANYFYYWRINYADKNMMSETYKNIPSNTYSSKDTNMDRYVKMAQGPEVSKNIKDKSERMKEEEKAKRMGLLNMSFVEHFPRGYLHYHTHTYIDKGSEKFNFKFNDKYLAFRKDIIQNAIKKDPYKESDSKRNAFIMRDKELEKTFNPAEILKKHGEVQKFAAALSSLLNHLHAREEVYVKEGGKKELSPKSISLAKDVVESIKDDIDPNFKLKKGHIEGFIERNGTVTPTIFDTFLYSRSFYVFLLCTLNCELDKINIRDENRPLSVARMYAELATNMFKTTLNDDKPSIWFFERKFGKATDTEYNDKKMKEKLAEAKKKDGENLKTLLSYFSKYKSATLRAESRQMVRDILQ
ncbi:UNVERIFIED_CONTAM: hypothetical protein PYX00_011293 [Menopon gallinae]|uniref:Uncharacterized protein n=1 Tax=Menopon gallinae TaxID=328185 RepID=A0AAW2H7D7_9NEOP